MSIDPQFQVFPFPPQPQIITLNTAERKKVIGLDLAAGCSLLVVIFLAIGVFSIGVLGYVLWAVGDYFGFLSVFFGALIAITGSGIAVPLISFAIKRNKISKIERKRTDLANQAEINRVTSEAKSLTGSLRSTYQSSAELAQRLPKHLSQASSWLRNAESEYESSAFAPFWDAIENAAEQLALFNDKVKILCGNADEYYRKLEGRGHSFPVFPIQLDTIPDPSHSVEELRRVVRLGQTNFQFANIWEHRRTREVLIAGFRTLGDAVNRLGSTIDSSIYELQRSLSSDLATVVDEQIKTRESEDNRLTEQNRMLDNIQNRREPLLIDSPRKY